ncbi:MAG: DMT family transporter [Anaerolineales bacterium]
MKRLAGILLIALSAASFGTLAIFGRFAYADGMDTFTVLFLRFGFAALLMTLILILRREPLPRREFFLPLVGMGALGYVGQSFLYLTATRYASAGMVALLLYLYPFFVMLLSVLFTKERVTRPKAAALVLALSGAALTVGPVSGQALGALMAIAAALIYSVYIMVGAKVMKGVSATQSSTVIFASAGLVFGALALFNGAHLPASAAGWGAMTGVVFISTLIPVAAFLAGLGMIGAVNAAMISTLEPVVTVALAAWFFGERLGLAALLGGGLILAAVITLTRSETSFDDKMRTSKQ